MNNLTLQILPPSKKFSGPQSPEGETPIYSANGVQYFLASYVAFAGLLAFEPRLATWIYEDFAYIVFVLNLTALALCVYLLQSGREKSECNGGKCKLKFAGILLHMRGPFPA